MPKIKIWRQKSTREEVAAASIRKERSSGGRECTYKDPRSALVKRGEADTSGRTRNRKNKNKETSVLIQ
jgi:hypothetical protein